MDKKYKYMRYILLSTLVLLIVSCGSKKKSAEKTKEAIKIEAKIDSASIEVKDITEKTQTVNFKKTDISEVKKSFKGVVADTSKPAQVNFKEEPDGSTTITTSNLKTFDLKQDQNRVKDVDSTSMDLAKIDKSKNEKTSTYNHIFDANKKVKNSEKEIDYGFPWWLVIVIAAAYLIVSRWKKSFNPLQWWS